VDGSENSDRTARHLVDMAGHCGATVIRVVNVQPPLLYVEVPLQPRQEVIDSWMHKSGKDAVRSVCALLDAAGIPYVLELAEGKIVEILVQYTERGKCNMIFMGTRGMGTVANLALGLVATKVIHLAQIPVTLVK
jgi:nucleotide-binding universal stress UspA family protein